MANGKASPDLFWGPTVVPCTNILYHEAAFKFRPFSDLPVRHFVLHCEATILFSTYKKPPSICLQKWSSPLPIRRQKRKFGSVKVTVKHMSLKKIKKIMCRPYCRENDALWYSQSRQAPCAQCDGEHGAGSKGRFGEVERSPEPFCFVASVI